MLVTLASFAIPACPQDPTVAPASAAAPTTAAASATAAAADPLPSWNDGTVKTSLVAFVERTTKPDAPDFVPPSSRVAVFDNDGTLWAEQPMYTQLAFARDRVKALDVSNDLERTVENLLDISNEYGAEFFYSWAPVGWSRLTADLQVVDSFLRRSGTRTFFALRWKVSF